MEEKVNVSERPNLIELAKQYRRIHAATIELTTICNWQCLHCFIPDHDKIGLSYEEILAIFNQLRDMGCFELVLTGGEIFARDDAFDIIKKAREMHFNVTLFSNISLLNEIMVEKLSGLYLREISCTVFSLNPILHDKITKRKGSLHKVLRNIDLLIKYNIPIEVKTILMSADPDAYKHLNEFCLHKGIEYLATTYICAKSDNDKSPKKLSLNEQQLEKAIGDIDDLLNLPRRPRSMEDNICNSIQYSLFIDCSGNVYPCNNMLVEVGSLLSSSLKEIWHASEKLAWIKNLKWQDCRFCKNCLYRDGCDRCAGIIFLEEGDLLGRSETYCSRAQIRYNIRKRQIVPPAF